MTFIEFNAHLLSRKLTMAEHEAAKIVLVHGASLKEAASMYQLTELQLSDVLKLFEAAR